MHSSEEWAELMARTIAHLAAQLTMTQIRLRAMATELAAHGQLDESAVRVRVGQIASAETATYLRENLGEALAEVVDLDALEREISAFLQP
jgi:hypothetical protein